MCHIAVYKSMPAFLSLVRIDIPGGRRGGEGGVLWTEGGGIMGGGGDCWAEGNVLVTTSIA